jgi:hypothetical protein
MPSLDINWLAVLVAVVAHQFIGFLWYGPVFGKIWLAGMGKTREEMTGAAGGYVVAIVASLVTAIALALFLTLPPPEEVNTTTGIVYGLIASIGFVVASVATTAVFENRSMTVPVLFATYQVIGITIMGAILGAWR